jgi:hypothetical protein
MSIDSPDALSPQTLQATKVFVLVDDELDELESAADDVVGVDDVGENGWTSEMTMNKKKNY